MKAKIVAVYGNWRAVADAARTTIGLEAGEGEPSSKWKLRMLFSDHSPIRILNFVWVWEGLPYWASCQIARHNKYMDHFVSTQRTDRTGVNRDPLPQGAPVTHRGFGNASSIITTSRKRLCGTASPETRYGWSLFKTELSKVEPEVASVCVPDCVYRGACFEYKCCGYDKTPGFKRELTKYRELLTSCRLN